MFCAGAALALPNEFAQQGYVVDQRGPLNGEHDVRVRIYDRPNVASYCSTRPTPIFCLWMAITTS